MESEREWFHKRGERAYRGKTQKGTVRRWPAAAKTSKTDPVELPKKLETPTSPHQGGKKREKTQSVAAGFNDILVAFNKKKK